MALSSAPCKPRPAAPSFLAASARQCCAQATSPTERPAARQGCAESSIGRHASSGSAARRSSQSSWRLL
jgi:hypothetical protein